MDTEVYCGDYITCGGMRVPYVFTIGQNRIYVKYDIGDGQREKSMKAVADEFGEFSWRLAGKKIYFNSPTQLKRLFTEFDSYARATFKYVTGVM